MPGRQHALAVEHLGRCECPCHQHQAEASDCWCSDRAAWPYRIAHNDAVHLFGGCPSHRHGQQAVCNVPTEPRWRQIIDAADRKNRDKRIMRGQIRSSSDVNRAIQLGVIGRRAR